MRLLRKFAILPLVMLILALLPLNPAQSQEEPQFQWDPPLNPGEMPSNSPFLPPASAMPVLPLRNYGALQPGTLFFNVEDFSAGYRILTLTLDTRLFAFNITTGFGVLPVSPNGQYGIYTIDPQAQGLLTCGILDLVTNVTVDRFETDSTCDSASWSPDSTRVLFTTRDDNGAALGIRQNATTILIRPFPAGAVDMGLSGFEEGFIYIVESSQGWVSDEVISFEMGVEGALSQQVFSREGAFDAAYPAQDLTLEQTGKRLVTWLPSQPVNALFRGVWLTDVVQGNSFELAPTGSTALFADVSPDDNAVVYWAATKGTRGWTHPFRLVIYYPDDDRQVVLLQFDGPTDDIPVTRPGLLVWNPEGIYFYISQQEGTPSALQTGTYRIQPDGSTLEFITPELLFDSLEP